MNDKFWNENYWKDHLKNHENEKLDFVEDLWINEYDNIVEMIPKGKAIDLGCGIGQYTKYLFDKGFDVISADISTEALNNLKEVIPSAKILQLDMSKPLEFADDTFDLVFANLSIHFFDKSTTTNLLKEIRRILKNDGYFIGTVNSSKAYEFIKDHAVKIEDDFYLSKERYVRLWDKDQFTYFFKDFEEILLEEVRITRWNKPKDMWKFIYKNKK